MKKLPVIAIYDVGKTNKKLLLFNDRYQTVYEENRYFDEIKDEDLFPCEDVHALTGWLKESFEQIKNDRRFDIRAVNYSGYGASLVLLDKNLKPFLPLYNYLKPYPGLLKEKFYHTYGGEDIVAKQTASPVLGNLNSGMQLYRLKYEKPQQFNKIKYALHLPQYLSFVFTGKLYSELTSIGCHTHLWDFQHQQYHSWVIEEAIDKKFPPIIRSDAIGGHVNQNIPVGTGLHDSSAALIPYLTSFSEPFILLSTGTWCISLNPFNRIPLSVEELRRDCLCYLSYKGEPVKASRLFAGHEHEGQSRRIAEYFQKPADYYKNVVYNPLLVNKNALEVKDSISDAIPVTARPAFGQRAPGAFKNYEAAYHQLISDIIAEQVRSTNIVLKDTNVKRIFVDGGFCNNPVYMQLLAEAFPGIEIYAAEISRASAMGAALCMHSHWNPADLPPHLIKLKHYLPLRG